MDQTIIWIDIRKAKKLRFVDYQFGKLYGFCRNWKASGTWMHKVL
jgi:hypothetical protein